MAAIWYDSRFPYSFAFYTVGMTFCSASVKTGPTNGKTSLPRLTRPGLLASHVGRRLTVARLALVSFPVDILLSEEFLKRRTN